MISGALFRPYKYTVHGLHNILILHEANNIHVNKIKINPKTKGQLQRENIQ
jgi:hypothetical protein